MSVLQPLDVSLNKPFKLTCEQSGYPSWKRQWLKLKKQKQSLSDDPFGSSDEDEENADAIVIKSASRQTLVNWVASAWKVAERPSLVSKSFEVTGITVNNNDDSVRNEDVQEEIATGFDANTIDHDVDSEEESEREADKDSDGEDLDSDSSDLS